jgi:hypothetical protein
MPSFCERLGVSRRIENGKRIHVGANGHAGAHLSAFENGDDPVTADVFLHLIEAECTRSPGNAS